MDDLAAGWNSVDLLEHDEQMTQCLQREFDIYIAKVKFLYSKSPLMSPLWELL